MLRALRPSDDFALFRYRSNAEVARYQTWEPQSLAWARGFIASQAQVKRFAPGEWTQLGIALAGSDEVVGDCGVLVSGEDGMQASFGITLDPDFGGRGLATAAVRALVGHLFLFRGMHRVSCSVDARNLRSLALMERVGMRREAHHVDSLWFKGGWTDDVVFAVLAREWPRPGGEGAPGRR